MNKKVFRLALVAVLLAFTFPAQAQQSRVYRVAIFSSGQPGNDPDNLLMVGLRDGLKEAGYVESKNLILSVPEIKTVDELRSFARRYTKEKVDVFVTIGVTETAIAKEANLKTPIIFMPAVDPQRAGFVKSLAHPGTNLTGLAYDVGFEIRGKQLEILKDIASSLRRVLVVYDANVESPIHYASVQLLHKIGPRLGLTLIEKPIKSFAEAEEAVSRESVNGIFILCTNVFSRDERTPAVAIKKKLPLHGCPTQAKKFGALVSYGPDLYYIGRRGAWYVDQILKGMRPQNLPVENPKKFELVINLKTADVIGLKIPPEVLQRADKVIR